MLSKFMRLISILILFLFSSTNIAFANVEKYPVIGYIGNEKTAHVTINDKKIITLNATKNLDPLAQTKLIAKKLNKLLYNNQLRADRILPGLRQNKYLVKAGKETILSIDKEQAKFQKTHPTLLTMKIANNLRKSLGGNTFDYTVSRGLPSYTKSVQYGYSSWYGKLFHGRHTSSGEVYDMHGYTAAHRTLPLGTPILVTNLQNGRSILVKVNDRGPFAKTERRILDLSKNAFKAIAPLGAGVIRIRVDVLD